MNAPAALRRSQPVGEEIANSVSYGHFVWHLFVIAGTVCHFIAVRC